MKHCESSSKLLKIKNRKEMIMNNSIKKFLSIIMTVALIAGITTFSPVTAQAAIEAPKSETLYAQSVGDIISFSVYGIPSGKELDVPTVKSSATSVATIYNVYSSASNNEYAYESAYIDLKVKKFGTTTVSYKIGGKTYKTKIKIKKYKVKKEKYTNPIKSITVSGINSGKDFSSKFDKQEYIPDAFKLSGTQENAKVEIKAKSGYEVDSISVYETYNNGYHNVSKYILQDSDATFDSLTFKKSDNISYSISVSMHDKEGNYAYISFSFK